MKRLSTLFALLFVLSTLPLFVFADTQTWKDVSVVDSMCLEKVKSDPDKHERKCLLQCGDMGGYGILDADGKYLKLDDEGSAKLLDLLKASDKKDHIRVNIEGEKSGDTIKVSSVTLN
jgi:hypothetical protein